MEGKDLISVIVPIYNVEPYLRPCIESILAQTYTHLQIILVDDGSTDSSGEICDEYAGKDNRIEVIHQKNAGISPARNTGLERARGEFISFVDGDDFIHPRMYEVMLEVLLAGEYSFSMILGKMVYENDDNRYAIVTPYAKTVLTQEVLMRSLFNHTPLQDMEEWQIQVVWNKLYRREQLKDEFFRQTGTEDTEYNNRIFLKSSQVAVIDASLYYWVQRPSSITHQKVNARYIDRANSYYLCLQDISQDRPLYRACCLEKLYKTMVNVRYHATGTPFHELACRTVKELKGKTFKEFVTSKHISFRMKFLLILFYYLPPLYSGFMKVCEAKARRR